MRFYADENFPRPVVAELRRLGHDVLTAFEDGRANKRISDEAVLNRARRLSRILLTNNRVDFRRLHTAGHDHAGIVLCTVDTNFRRQASRIHAGCESISEWDQRMINVYRPD